jgi:hypothetical protein
LGVVTSSGTDQFRKTKDYRVSPVKKEYVPGNPGLADRDFVYGKPTPFVFMMYILIYFS